MKKRNWLNGLIITVPILFLYLPMLVMVVFSFNNSKSLSSWAGFSFRWYEELFSNTQMINAIFISVTIAILATIISTILGTISAIGLSRNKKIVKELILQVNNLPIMNPDIVTGVALMLLFTAFRLNKGYLTLLLAHIAFCTPFVLTNVYQKVKQLDPNLADAAYDLGATPFQALVQVIIPQISSGIMAGALLAFTMSFDDFVISYFVSGNGVENISIVVYNMAKRTNPSIYALASIILLVVLLITFIPYIIVKILDKKEGTQTDVFTRISRIGWKKLSIVGLVFALGLGFFYNKSHSKQVLKVFNAGEYIDTTVLDDFEEEFNCEVIYETFDSNESMYTKYMGGNAYDVLVPSDYTISRLIEEEQLLEIDYSIVDNLSNIDSSLLNLEFDPNNTYSVPYFCGNVGIVYDKTQVDEKDLKEEGWNILMDTKYKGNIYMYDNERDSFMVAEKACGISMNTTDEKDYDTAYNWLIKQRETMDPVYVGDECIDNMTSAIKAMAVMYSGDAAYVLSENEDLGFYLPTEGVNYWFDSFIIPKTCANYELANEFIEFMTRDDIALRNTNEVGYFSANTYARNVALEEDYNGNVAYTIRMGKNDEYYHHLNAEYRSILSERWTKVLSK